MVRASEHNVPDEETAMLEYVESRDGSELCSPRQQELEKWVATALQAIALQMRSFHADPLQGCPSVAKTAAYAAAMQRLAQQYDVLAGICVGCMAVPQTVCFASMAGLPAAYGLYSTLAPIVAYALVGGSRNLAIGPVALISLLLNDGLVAIIPGAEANTNPNRPADPAAQAAYNRAAIQVSLLSGLLFMAAAALRMGRVTRLLTPPIISSFLTGGSIIIAMSQAKSIIGCQAPRSSRLQDLLWGIFSRLDELRWQEFCMGCTWLALLAAVKMIASRSRAWIAALGPISVACLSMLAVHVLHLDRHAGIQTVGPIRPGLPGPTLDWWWPVGQGQLWGLVKTAALCDLIGLLESISIASALAEEGEVVKPTQEIVGLGIANVAAAAFQGYPVTGSFARSAVNKDAGARSGLAGVFTAAVISLALLFFTPAFQQMPLNALAAIVIAGVSGLMDPGGAWRHWQESYDAFSVWLVCFAGCLFIGIDAGLGLGVLVSLLWRLGRHAASYMRTSDQQPGPREPLLNPS